jgi:Mce-associated membrane protein
VTAPDRGRHRRDSSGAPAPVRLLTVVSVACAVLCLPALAALVLLLLRGPASDSTAHARHDALGAATKAAHDLLSYDYRTLSGDVARAKAETTGAFAQQYAQTAGQLLGQAAKLKAIVQASVGSPGVVSADGDTVVVLVFVDQASVKQLPGQKSPTTRIDQSRVQLTMTKVHGHWLVSALAAL